VDVVVHTIVHTFGAVVHKYRCFVHKIQGLLAIVDADFAGFHVAPLAVFAPVEIVFLLS